MDWNWFFSTVAQSFAAIVGLVGAFVFTRLVNAEVEHTEQEQRLRDLLHEAQKLEGWITKRNFEWYNRQKRESALDRLEYKLTEDDGPQTSPEEYASGLDLSPWDDRTGLVQEVKKVIDEFYEEEGSTGTSWYLGQAVRTSDVTKLHIQRQRLQERERLKRVTNDAINHARKVRAELELARKNPQHSSAVSVTLIVLTTLFFVGVVYPAGFLPFPEGAALQLSLGAVGHTVASFQGVVLGLGSLLFLCVVGLLFSRNEKLRHDPELLGQLEPYASPENYSDFVGTWLENRGRQG